MASEVDIFNKALGRLGVQAVTSTEEDTEAARACRRYYDEDRRNMLCDYDFGFAISRMNLSESTDDNNTHYDYIYNLPNDFLSMICILDDDDKSETETEYLIEGNKLYANVSPCWIRYVQDRESPAEFTDPFIEALYLKLAADICMRLTGDKTLRRELCTELKIHLPASRAHAGKNKVMKLQPTKNWGDYS